MEFVTIGEVHVAGLITGYFPHFIDHIAPFCALFGCPLIVWDEEIGEVCRRFYPELEVIETEKLPDFIISCTPRAHLEQVLGPWSQHRYRVIWLPHGLSDKGWKSPFFEALGREDLALVYGQRMREVFGCKEVKIPQFSIGNFRKQYYEHHQIFYDRQIDQILGEERFVLYAPTWDDCENNGTFWEAFPRLVNTISEGERWVIKLHPNTLQAHLDRVERCKGKIGSKNIFFLEEFVPIYPLLARTNTYIGDMSSIGYDFLPFNKPLFFLRKERTDPHTDPSAHLMQAGEQILLDQIGALPSHLLAPDLFAPIRQKLNAHAFDSPTNWEERLRKEIRCDTI